MDYCIELEAIEPAKDIIDKYIKWSIMCEAHIASSSIPDPDEKQIRQQLGRGQAPLIKTQPVAPPKSPDHLYSDPGNVYLHLVLSRATDMLKLMNRTDYRAKMLRLVHCHKLARPTPPKPPETATPTKALELTRQSLSRIHSMKKEEVVRLTGATHFKDPGN